MLSSWPSSLIIIAALLYVILPWDFDFIPFFGRIDDVVVMALAISTLWKRKKVAEARRRGSRPRGEEEAGGSVPPPGAGEKKDPYAILGVEKDAPEEDIRKAWRELLGKYHPDRVQHLGEEFREIASKKTAAINGAYERIRQSRGFS